MISPQGVLHSRAVKRDRLILFGILAVATTLRIFWNDVAHYSPADEKVYCNYTRFLLDHSYRELVTQYLADPSRWIYPDPLRWGYFLLSTTACRVSGHCDERTLAWLSTLAGIASVWLTYRLGTRLVSQNVGLLAAALMVSSPLQLALGRRALQDEVFGAAVLLALLAFVDENAPPWKPIAALTFAFAVKPTFLLIYPALGVLSIVAIRRRGWRRTDLLILGAPPLLCFLGFALFSRSAGDFFRVLSALSGATSAEYVVRYQNGPPHRILFDLIALSPIVCLLAAGAVALVARRPDEAEPGLRSLVLFTVTLTLVFAAVSSKNVRYAVALDPPIRILAAWSLLVFLRQRWLYLTVAVMAVAELAIFHTIFITGQVYDPVTDNLMRALQAIP